MALNFRKFLEGLRIVPKTSSTASEKGDLDVTSGDGKLNYHNGTSASPIITEAHSANLSNKTIDTANTNTVKINGNSLSATAGTATITIPNSTDTLVGRATSDTLTNKTIDGDDNTIQDVSIGSLKTVLADANKVIRRDAAGVIISGNALLNTSQIVTLDSSDTLTNKTIDGDNNTIQDVGISSLKTVLADANKVIRRDVAGAITSGNSVPNSSELVTTDSSSIFTNKTFDAEGTGNSLSNIKDSNIKIGAAINRAKLASGTANHVIINDGTGVLSSEASLAISRGGTGQTTQTNAFDALAPTTTAGDFIVHNGTDNVRQGIGSDGQVLVVDTAQTNKLKWTTLQQGAKNYITYGTFENNATTGWSLFNTTLTSKIPTGSITAGAASITSFAVDATTPIAGTYDLRVASSGVLAAGQGFISDAFTIDREDQAKPLTFSFAYEAVSGTMDFSGTSNNTWAVYIYDGSAWIQPAGVYNLVQSSGVGIASGSFQTTATGTQYRIAVICITATSGAVEMRFDSFSVGPQNILAGAAISDWVSARTVPALIGTTTNPTTSSSSVKYRRIGDSYEISWYYMIATAGSGIYRVQLPDGLTIDTTKIPQAFSVNTGSGRIFDLSTGINYNLTSRVDNNISTSITLCADGVTGGGVISSTIPITFAVGDEIWFSVILPISGLSSNTVMSNDTDTRVVAAKLYRNSNTAALTAATDTLVSWNTSEVDTHSGWNGSDTYTVPVSGIYKISGNIAYNIGPSAQQVQIKIYISGVLTDIPSLTNATASQFNVSCPFATIKKLNAGQTIKIYAYADGSGTIISSDSNKLTQVSIERLSGPATIAASETVGCTYDTLAAGTITSAGNDLIYTNRIFDTHGAFNTSTGEYTVPVSGKYSITGQFRTITTAMTVGFGTALSVKIDNTVTKFIANVRTQTTSGIIREVSGAPVTLNLLAGQKIKLHAFSDTSATIDTGPNALFNWVSIMRTGN